MAHSASPAAKAVVRRRVLFGLLDADGWAWAGVKSVFWFVVIVTMLGYIPDRAYYFTVGNTVDIWPLAPFLQWSPINLCPPENETVPCPAPPGATLPWHTAPAELQLPAGRTDGAAVVIGQTYIYAGGSDGTSAQSTTFVSHAVGSGNLDRWSQGPALPEARSDAASVVLGNTLYLIGGYGPDGKPTSTTYSLTVGNDGTIGAWTVEDKLALPQPRAGASAVSVSDGIVVMGGTDGTAATRTVWKAQQNTATPPVLGAWVAQPGALVEANMDGTAVHVGDNIYVIGGVNDNGNTVPTVQLGSVGGGPGATAKDPNVIDTWKASAQTNLPGPRTKPASFVSNGSIYVVGGSDGSQPLTELLWATPDANGVIPSWHHLPQTDLGQGIQGSAGVSSGTYAFIIGGRTAQGVTSDSARTYLAPALPFFELGLLGVTIPALKLGGEIGQQIGYLNAAGVGTVNFIVLILIGWAFAHKERVRSFIARRRR
jgi:N-acetylneuraminic acid mutarotase